VHLLITNFILVIVKNMILFFSTRCFMWDYDV
jgi:hypothetical protein